MMQRPSRLPSLRWLDGVVTGAAETKIVSVSREVDAAAATIFDLIADPAL